ncbi:MAG: hypothetical protein H6Q90_3225 [Deltaproteobacteria bacterium]|nr:hypothetical protein [Deltaproteobacteria bacterium]
MQARTLVLLAIVGTAGFIARRSADSHPAAPALVATTQPRTARGLEQVMHIAVTHREVARAAIPQLELAPGDPDDEADDDNSYIVNIPMPSRTFESVLGVAMDEQGDATGDMGDTLGVTFSGGTVVDDYIIDEESP